MVCKSQADGLPKDLFPFVAPLPVPVAEHLLVSYKRRRLSVLKDSQHILQKFLEDVDLLRAVAYNYMSPFILTGKLAPGERGDVCFSTNWLQNALTMHSPKKQPVPSQTFSGWHKRGLLRYQEYGQPELACAASLLIARMIDTRERSWLPSTLEAEEPRWWCFRQDSPTAPILTCPVPFPDDLPKGALLWTPWKGACWDNWMLTDEGAVQLTGKGITLHDLFQWDAEGAALQLPSRSELRLQATKQFILHRLSYVLHKTIEESVPGYLGYSALSVFPHRRLR